MSPAGGALIWKGDIKMKVTNVRVYQPNTDPLKLIATAAEGEYQENGTKQLYCNVGVHITAEIKSGKFYIIKAAELPEDLDLRANGDYGPSDPTMWFVLP
jgi:hypothetical protein